MWKNLLLFIRYLLSKIFCFPICYLIYVDLAQLQSFQLATTVFQLATTVLLLSTTAFQLTKSVSVENICDSYLLRGTNFSAAAQSASIICLLKDNWSYESALHDNNFKIYGKIPKSTKKNFPIILVYKLLCTILIEIFKLFFVKLHLIDKMEVNHIFNVANIFNASLLGRTSILL